MTMLGRFLKEAPPAPGRPPKNGSDREPLSPLEAIGLSKKDSMEAQALARIADETPVVYEAARGNLAPVR